MFLYLLTVLTTILLGLALARGFLNRRFEQFSEKTGFVNKGLYRIILGLVSILIGFINLFPTYGDFSNIPDIPVLGELLPSLAGIGGGVLLLLEYSRSRKSIAKAEATKPAGEVSPKSHLKAYLNIVGLASIIIGILHAVFPKVPLL